MENNYYTPSLEEFHIGFEFETSYLEDYDTWKKVTLEFDDFGFYTSTWEVDSNPTEFRVKYLDKEDIESLGWKKEENCFVKDHCKLYLYGNTHIQIQSLGNLNFNGTIKNKSELIKLLKQLNITNE